MNWVSSADMSSISGSLGDCPSGETDAPHHEQTPYEAGLFAHFETSDPPPTIFGPVDLDWKYVRAQIVRQSRDCRAVLLGIYCYSEVHQTWVEGTAWDRNRKSRYHQLAWSEVQSCLVMKVPEPVLRHVFTTVLMLMLAEVGDSLETCRIVDSPNSICRVQTWGKRVRPSSTQPIYSYNASMAGLGSGRA